jgi:hypothetical protein
MKERRRRAQPAPAPKPWVFGNGVAHRLRRGVRVPAPECLPPFDRVPVARFAALMERMMADGERGAAV